MIISEKIAQHKEKLSLIQKAMDAEMQKKIYDRDKNLLGFLGKEKSVYVFAIRELEETLEELIRTGSIK